MKYIRNISIFLLFMGGHFSLHTTPLDTITNGAYSGGGSVIAGENYGVTNFAYFKKCDNNLEFAFHYNGSDLGFSYIVHPKANGFFDIEILVNQEVKASTKNNIEAIPFLGHGSCNRESCYFRADRGDDSIDVIIETDSAQVIKKGNIKIGAQEIYFDNVLFLLNAEACDNEKEIPHICPPPPPPNNGMEYGSIEFMVRTNPAEPQNERFLDDWRIEVHAIDDLGRPASMSYFASTDYSGLASIALPIDILSMPLEITASNELLSYYNPDEQIQKMSIFIPASCGTKATWMVGPVENALWSYYKTAASRRGEAWNPSQVDCQTWIANLQALVSTDEIGDELNAMSDSARIFEQNSLLEALQKNQELLTPTRPPICMAERRHNSGGLERGTPIAKDAFPLKLQGKQGGGSNLIDLGENGFDNTICGENLSGSMSINGQQFLPKSSFLLDEEDFFGVIYEEKNILPFMNANVYQVRHTNGHFSDALHFDDACSMTTLVEFINTDDDEQDIKARAGVTIYDLFDTGIDDAGIYLTSNGDKVVDDQDTWAIFYDKKSLPGQERVITVSLPGHRQEDFRDILHMKFGQDGMGADNLFIGLRSDYELNEQEVDGEQAFMTYTMTVWDGSSEQGRAAVKRNIANCYQTSDIWMRQYFITQDLQPLRAAEFEVRSQCFSNSRSQQRWQTDDVGFWSMNTHHGVAANVIVNPGWLAPGLAFELYIQKFDEAVFKGPRTISYSDDNGQLISALPTLVEGDRVLIKAKDSYCDDYTLILPCFPEFTGFAGIPGVPYLPIITPPPSNLPLPPTCTPPPR